MLKTWLALFAFTSVLGAVSALDVHGKIAWNALCKDVHELGYARAILDSGATYSAGITHDGSFVIPDVPEGTYVLSIRAHDHFFEQYRIDVPPSTELTKPTPDVRPHIPGTPLHPGASVAVAYPVTPAALRQNAYYIAPEQFDVTGMLKSPMVLMSVGVGVMMLAMPYLMKNMDEESLNDLKENQAKIAGAQNAFATGDFKSGLSALMNPGQPETPPAAASPNVRQRTTKNKRR